MLIYSCKEGEGNQEHENIDTLFQIGRNKWDIDRWYFYGDPIYDTDDDSSRAQITDFVSWTAKHIGGV
jgi:hypothetical protein